MNVMNQVFEIKIKYNVIIYLFSKWIYENIWILNKFESRIFSKKNSFNNITILFSMGI